MIYLDDKLPMHPKILKAGEMLGPNGGAQVLALYVSGLSYAREHLTDGFIPAKYVESISLLSRPYLVARVMTSRAIRLWHKVPGGYRIHDYHDWNKTAFEVKEMREKERVKKAAQRAGKSNGRGDMSRHVSRGDTSRPPCARGTTIHLRKIFRVAA